MRFFQLDVFADTAYQGNPLAVFPDAGSLTTEQMALLAREMNLSETTFVLRVEDPEYEVRIFTPAEELPFAGHPTLGTAWILRKLGRLTGNEVTQVSAAGVTPVSFIDGDVWFQRSGSPEPDLFHDPSSGVGLALALGLELAQIGLDAGPLGGDGTLQPARSDAGLTHLMVPLRDLDALASVKLDADLIQEFSPFGAYCFTCSDDGHLRSRGFFPGSGIPEDPGTGSAVACLGVYLSDRIGRIELVVDQGVEMGRHCRMSLRAEGPTVYVGGACQPIFEGDLQHLP